MLDQLDHTENTGVVARVVGLFPNADEVVVRALTTQGDAMQRYLAQANQLTRAEVQELLSAFVHFDVVTPHLRTAS